MLVDELITKFTHFLWYIPHVREERDKVQCFINFLPLSFKEQIEYDNPNTMDEVIIKAKLCYQHAKKRDENLKLWPNKKKEIFFEGGKGGKLG